MMPEMSTVARRLREYRKQEGKTQFEMGAEMGISTEEVSLIEREKKNDIKLSTLQKMAAHMGITVAALVAVEGNEDEDEDENGA